MSAYAIVDVHIIDVELYLEYQHAVRPLVESAGAVYLARGGEFLVFEGDYQPNRIILLEFPSLEAMQSFYRNPAYQALESQRKACSYARIVGVSGLGS